MSKLVIVESPAKAKNIKGYLGKGYDVVASMGHVRVLLRRQQLLHAGHPVQIQVVALRITGK